MVKKFHLPRHQFKKLGRQIHGGLTKVSHGISKAGSGIEKAGRLGEKAFGTIQTVASNPIVQGAALAFAPEIAVPLAAGAVLAGQAKNISHGVRKGGEAVKSVGETIDPENIKSSIQRSKPKSEDSNSGITFH
jgi:hypothetical protein